MTKREMVIGAAGVAAGAGLVGTGILLGTLLGGFDDEGGIRVKNGGSVYIETVSTKGFDFNMTATEFRTRRDTKGCYDLTVVEGSSGCAQKVLYQLKGVEFTTTDRASHGIGLSGKKIAVKRGKGWKAKGQGNLDLTYGTQDIDLLSLTAIGEDSSGATEVVQCTFAGQKRQFNLASVDCK